MTTEIIVFVIIGSLLGKMLILRALNDLPKTRRPDIWTFTFLLAAIIDVVLGFSFTYVQYKLNKDSMSILLALQISATAPLIATSIVKSIPTNSVFIEDKG